MKKLIALLLCLVMVLGLLVACTPADDGNDETTTQVPETTTEAPEETTEAPEETTEETTAAPVVTDPILYTALLGEENGANGLTFYYTDGETLTPFTEWSTTADWGWVHGEGGVLVYPKIALADNYGVAGSSATEYVVVGYELPNSGSIELATWTALQGPSGDHGYKLKVALDDIGDVLHEHDIVGDTQTVVAQNYNLDVEAGQILYVIYEPVVKNDGEWYGYKLQVTYTEG